MFEKNEDGTYRRLPPLTASKRVIVEVIGGDVDGLTLDSQIPNEFEKVESLMFMSNNGKVGTGFKGCSLTEMFGLMDGTTKIDPETKDWGFINYYWVRENLEEGDTVLIRLFYESKKVRHSPPPQAAE